MFMTAVHEHESLAKYALMEGPHNGGFTITYGVCMYCHCGAVWRMVYLQPWLHEVTSVSTGAGIQL